MFRDPNDNPLTDGLKPEHAAWLSEGLRELRDVPPHGLSNERLRDRLLAHGLDAKPAPSATPAWWAWALAPAAAALVVFAVAPALSSRLRPSRSGAAPTVVMGPNAVALADPTLHVRPRVVLPGPFLPATPAAEALVADGAEPDLRDAMVAELARAEAPSPRTLRSALPTRRVARPHPLARRRSLRPDDLPAATPRPDRSPSDAGTLVALVAPSPAPTSGAAPDVATLGEASKVPAPKILAPKTLAPRALSGRSALAKAEPLVILASEIDADTGAGAATEVDSHTNVSVGG